MRKLVVGALASLAVGLGGGELAGASATAAPSRAVQASSIAVVAKTCPSGFTHAVIGGRQKCLRAGEYCAHRYASQYRHYRYKCVLVSGVYRLRRT